MEIRHKKPGSVRLTDAQYQEMEHLGISNESAYVKYKIDHAQHTLEHLKAPLAGPGIKTLPVTQQKKAQQSVVEDRLTIQRLAMENQKLQEKLEEISKNNEETLHGVHHKVHSLLQEELQKRDFETLNKDYALRGDKIKELEKNLQETKKESQTKQEEIEALVKKLGFVELGKALLPGAISGLAKQYPSQMKGIAGTLGRLGLSENDPLEETEQEDQEELLQIAAYFKELFSEEQLEQVVQLIVQLGDQLKDDTTLLQKIGYYLQQLKRKTTAKQQRDQVVKQ